MSLQILFCSGQQHKFNSSKRWYPAEFLLIFRCPFYYEAKTVLVVYLGIYNGARTLYNKYLRSFLSKHEGEIDQTFKDIIMSIQEKVYH